MKKNLARLGTALSRVEAKNIIGGYMLPPGEEEPAACNSSSCTYFLTPSSTTLTTGTCGSMGGIRTDCGCDGKVSDSNCNKFVA